MIDKTMAERYKLAYQLLFDNFKPEFQKRILAVKENNNIKDSEVDEFVRAVIVIAETSETEELKRKSQNQTPKTKIKVD